MVYDKGENKQYYQFLKLRKVYMNTFYEKLIFIFLFICIYILLCIMASHRSKRGPWTPGKFSYT